MLKDTQVIRKKWNQLEKTIKLKKAHEDTVLMDMKEFAQLLRQYKSTWVLLDQAGKAVDDAVEKTASVLQEKRQQEVTSTGRRKRHRTNGSESSAENSFTPLAVGTKVAALTPGSRRDDAVWIYASVVNYLPHKKKYEVMDEDEGEDGDSPKEYMLSVSNVVELPLQCHFEKGDLTLAMFPGTTSFYPAVVVRRTRDYCEVQFEDDADETGQTPARKVRIGHIVELPNMHR